MAQRLSYIIVQMGKPLLGQRKMATEFRIMA